MTKDEDLSEFAILSDEEILKRLDQDLVVYPLIHRPTQVQQCKVDLRLSGIFYEIKHSALGAYDPLDPPWFDYRRKVILPIGYPYILHPHCLVLAPVFECVSIPPDLLGILQGRSSLGRLGIIIHATAGFIDPGYSGTITLELSNLGHLPVKFYSLQRIASLAFAKIGGNVKLPYGSEVPYPLRRDKGKYSSPLSLPSKLEKDWENRILASLKRKITEVSDDHLL